MSADCPAIERPCAGFAEQRPLRVEAQVQVARFAVAMLHEVQLRFGALAFIRPDGSVDADQNIAVLFDRTAFRCFDSVAEPPQQPARF